MDQEIGSDAEHNVEAIEGLQKIAVARASGNIPPQSQPSQTSPAQFKATASSAISQSQPVTSLPTDEDDLSSERFGANYYAKLRDLLKSQDWKGADRETVARMLEVMDRQEEGRLGKEGVKKFPCQDLRVIDQLWVKYSQGKFGFSVQKKIYVECGGNLDGEYPGHEIWNKFGDRVGWFKYGDWLYYRDLHPSLDSPDGNFPRGGPSAAWCWWGDADGIWARKDL